MQKLCQQLTLLLIFLCCYAVSVLPVEAKIVMNEIFPAPSISGTASEWVEIYNDGDQEVDISGFSLKDNSNTNLSFEGTKIPPHGFLTATSSNVLNNSGDSIFLRDTNNVIIDSVAYGTITTNNVFIRCPDGKNDWIVSNIPTRNSSNNANCVTTPSPTLIPTNTPTLVPTQTISPSITHSPNPTELPSFDVKNISISEVMVYPNTQEKEWVELFNNSDKTIQLTNWFIDDVHNGGSSPRPFTLTIPAKSFEIIELSSGIFNNDEDHVRLLDDSQQEIIRFEYDESKQGKTWGINPFVKDEFCMQEPSQKNHNNPCFIINLTQTPTPTTSKSTVLGTTKQSSVPTSTPGRNTAVTTPKLKTLISKPTIKALQREVKSFTQQQVNPSHVKQINVTPQKNYDSIETVTYNAPQKMAIDNFFFTAGSYATLGLASIVYKLKHAMEISLF